MLPAAGHALVLALLHFVWLGAVIGALAWVSDRALSRQAASLRYAVLHGWLWAMAVAFAWTYAWLLGGDARHGTPGTGAVTSELGTIIVFGAWAFGASWRGARLAIGLVGVARWRARAVPLPAAWTDTLGELAIAMGVRMRVQIAALAGIDTPIVIGVFRPLVLVPLAYAAGVPTAAMRAALCHELAHVLRHDYLLQLLHGTIEAVLFYHPCVRWLGARLRVLREYCCDDLAISRHCDPLDYARGLAELEGARAVASPALAATGASLMSRIDRLLNSSPVEPARGHIRTAAVTAWLGLALAVAPAVIAPACSATGDDVDPDRYGARRGASRGAPHRASAARHGSSARPGRVARRAARSPRRTHRRRRAPSWRRSLATRDRHVGRVPR